MDAFWSILIAGGLAGAVSALLNQVLIEAMASRRQLKQLEHEGSLQRLAQRHEMGLQDAERQHQAILRQEAAHAKAAEWSVPLVAQCIFWVEVQLAKRNGQDVEEFLQTAADLSPMSDANQVLRALFRLATEHPSQAVRTYARELYNRLSTYFGPKSNEDRSYGFLDEPDEETLTSWKKYLDEFLLPNVHPVGSKPGSARSQFEP